MDVRTIRLRPEQVDAAWLTRVLRQSGLLKSARITDIESVPVGVGMLGDSIRFSLTYDRDEGAPASVVGKFPAVDPTSRATGRDFGLYLGEVRFYQEVAHTVSIRSPACYHADIDEAAGEFVLILEDMAPARPGNQLTGCSIVDAEQVVIQAAALHGPRWNDPALNDIPWLQDRERVKKVVASIMPDCLAEFHRRYDGVLEPEYMAVCDRYGAIAGDFLSARHSPVTLSHYDFRLDNMMFDAKGGTVKLVVYDWQSISVCSGALDISYFLGAGISIEERRRHEHDLLNLYLEELKRYGVTDYGWNELWRDYRLTLLQGVQTAIFASAGTKRTERGDQMFLTMARGGCAQAIDADPFTALAAL